MHVVTLRKVGNSITVRLPASVVEALDLHENDAVIVEVTGDRIIINRTLQDFQEAWSAYQDIEPRYHNANRKLTEQ